jgi:hypothetical protein
VVLYGNDISALEAVILPTRVHVNVIQYVLGRICPTPMLTGRTMELRIRVVDDRYDGVRRCECHEVDGVLKLAIWQLLGLERPAERSSGSNTSLTLETGCLSPLQTVKKPNVSGAAVVGTDEGSSRGEVPPSPPRSRPPRCQHER